MAEIGEGKHGDARLVAEAAGHARRFDRDFREILGGRHLGDRGVGDQDRAAARQHDRDADDAVAGLVVDHAPNLLEGDREAAGHAGHDRVRVAARDHRRGEIIAVLIDHSLAVAEQIALPLQPLIEELRIDHIALREASVVDLDPLVREIETRSLGGGRARALRGRPESPRRDPD